MSNPKKETRPNSELEQVAGGTTSRTFESGQENPENNPAYRLPPLDRDSAITELPGREAGNAGTA